MWRLLGNNVQEHHIAPSRYSPFPTKKKEAGMNTVEVDPNQLKDAPWGNTRRSRDPVAFQELRSSLRARGIMIHAPVARIVGVEYQLLAGYGRRDAAIAEGWPLISVKVVSVDDNEALAIMMDENQAREQLNAADEAEVAALMVARYNGDYAVAADHLGWRESLVRQRLTLNLCTNNVKDALRSSMIDIGHAVVLSQLADDKQDSQLPKVIQTKMSVADLKIWAANLSLDLTLGKFDKTACTTCRHNSTVQSDLFSTHGLASGLCGDSTCFKVKQKTWATEYKVELEGTYGTVHMSHESPIASRTTVGPSQVGEEQFKACQMCSNCVAVMDVRLSTVGEVKLNQCIDLECNSAMVSALAASIIATDKATSTKVSKQSAQPQQLSGPAIATTSGKDAQTATAGPSSCVPKVLSRALREHNAKSLRQAMPAIIKDNFKGDRFIRAMSIYAMICTYHIVLENADLENAGLPVVFNNRLGRPQFLDDFLKLDLQQLTALSSIVIMRVLGNGQHVSGTQDLSSDKFNSVLTQHVIETYPQELTEKVISSWQPTVETLKVYTKAHLQQVLSSHPADLPSFKDIYEETNGIGAFTKLSSMKMVDMHASIIEFNGFDWATFAPLLLTKPMNTH
jgi:PRTRC genetic system ParB family protein